MMGSLPAGSPNPSRQTRGMHHGLICIAIPFPQPSHHCDIPTAVDRPPDRPFITEKHDTTRSIGGRRHATLASGLVKIGELPGTGRRLDDGPQQSVASGRGTGTTRAMKQQQRPVGPAAGWQLVGAVGQRAENGVMHRMRASALAALCFCSRDVARVS